MGVVIADIFYTRVTFTAPRAMDLVAPQWGNGFETTHLAATRLGRREISVRSLVIDLSI